MGAVGREARLSFRRNTEQEDSFVADWKQALKCGIEGPPPVSPPEEPGEEPNREEGSSLFFTGVCVILGEGLLTFTFIERNWAAPGWTVFVYLGSAVFAFVLAALSRSKRWKRLSRHEGPIFLAVELLALSLLNFGTFCAFQICFGSCFFAAAFAFLALSEKYGWTRNWEK